MIQPPERRAGIVHIREGILADAMQKKVVAFIHISMRIRIDLAAGGVSDRFPVLGAALFAGTWLLPAAQDLDPARGPCIVAPAARGVGCGPIASQLQIPGPEGDGQPHAAAARGRKLRTRLTGGKSWATRSLERVARVDDQRAAVDERVVVERRVVGADDGAVGRRVERRPPRRPTAARGRRAAARARTDRCS